MYATRRLHSAFPPVLPDTSALDRILTQQAASLAAPALARTRYVGPAELQTIVRKGVRNHRVKMKRKTFVRLYRQAFPGADGRTVTDYWQRLAKRAFEKGGSAESPPTFSHEEMYDAYRLEVQEYRKPNERTLIDWITQLVKVGVIVRRSNDRIRYYEWVWGQNTPGCKAKKPRKAAKGPKVAKQPDFTRKPLGLASAKQKSGGGLSAVASDFDSASEKKSGGLCAFDVEDRNNHQAPPCPVGPDEADEAANSEKSKAAAPCGENKKAEETAHRPKESVFDILRRLERQAIEEERQGLTAEERVARQTEEERKAAYRRYVGTDEAREQACAESPTSWSPDSPDMPKPPKHDTLGTIAWLAWQAEKEQNSPEYQAKMRAEQERKKAYDAYCEAYDARQRQKEREREHRERQEAQAAAGPKARRRRVTKFADDHLVADAIFCQYQLRSIPFLREHWTQDFARRKYPRKVWRMAVAKALTKWNGQITKCRGAYVLSVADSIVLEGSADPRLMPDFRVVVPCKYAAVFSGVTEWTNEEADSSGAGQEI